MVRRGAVWLRLAPSVCPSSIPPSIPPSYPPSYPRFSRRGTSLLVHALYTASCTHMLSLSVTVDKPNKRPPFSGQSPGGVVACLTSPVDTTNNRLYCCYR